MTGLEQFVGTVLDEKYRLDRLLGKGGMGAVFLAAHLGTERPVALKIITPQFMQNSEFVERFKREARAAGRLRHPNVVDVTDFGFAHTGSERVAYLVMEYLDGCTLADVLAEESRLPLDWVVDIIEQVCSAVAEAHQQGILHRDLKPDNIWLEPNRLGGYRIKVLDFGIAKLADSTPPPLAVNSDEKERRSLSDALSPLRETWPTNSSWQHPEASEAATQVYAPTTVDEAQPTRIFLPETGSSRPGSSIAEAETQRLANPPPNEGDKTRLLDHQTDRNSRAPSTGGPAGEPTSAVTRVGAILGTPLYMSPEQCRGEQLDARSDIYSLGIITYQMLTGQTPFTGDMLSVMRMQAEEAPADLRTRNRKVPKRVAQHVMSALAKQPSARPANATAFADALRASAEGADTLLRRAFALYSEHFPTFLRLSLLAFAPHIVLTLMSLAFDFARWSRVLSPPVETAGRISFGVLLFIANYLAASVISGVTVLIVWQLSAAPLRPVQLRPAFAVLKQRWRPFFRTGIRLFLMVMLGFMLFVIPGLIVLYRYLLFGPVVIVEGLSRRAALTRARALMLRSRRTVLVVLLFHIAIPMLIGAFVGAKTGGAKDTLRISNILIERLVPLSHILLVPLFSIMTALLYLKTRRMGGETLKETFDQFEAQEAPRSQWQLRMRERLSTPLRQSRS